MNRDKVLRIVGVFLTVASILILISIPALDKIPSFLLGFILGMGLALFSGGENVFLYWKTFFKSKTKSDSNNS